MPKTTRTLTAAGVAAWFIVPLVAAAQTTPDADQIIRELRPNAATTTAPTRGIRPARPADQPAASPAASATADAPSVKLMVDFRTGSAALTPAAERTLDQLGRALTSETLHTYHFRIEGHTDTVGTPEANKVLATKRAEAVTAYLEKKFSIDAARLDAEGLGSEDLPVPTPDQTPEARNRIVRVVNMGS